MFEDYSNSNFKNLTYNGTTNYQPVPVSGVLPGIAPGTIVASGFSSLTDIQNQFIANSGIFQQVSDLLDNAGAGMTLCSNAPASIQTRIMRQIQPGETCWQFYKRMLQISMQYPNLDPYNQPTLAEQLSNNGNDILTDAGNLVDYPFTGNNYPSVDPRSTSYNQDPGKLTLLLMLFLAILKMVGNAIFAFMLGPIKWLGNSISSLYNSLTGNPITTGSAVSATTSASSANASSGGPPPQAGGDGITAILVTVANYFMNKAISLGPKLSTDVTRYDSLLISNYIQQMASNSMELSWPEAVLLLPQYLALLNQQNSTQNAMNYYGTNSLSSTQANSTIPAEVSSIFNIQNSYINSGLQRLTTALTYNVIDNGICCLIKVLGSLDTRFLNTILAILQLSQNRIGMKLQSLDSILNNLWGSIQKAILSTILSILYNLLGEINANITPTLQKLGTSSSNSCASWNLLSSNLLQFIGNVETSALAMAVEFANSLKFQDSYQLEYTNQLQQSTYIRVIFNLLKIIQEAVNSGALCNSSNIPTNLEIQNLLNSLPTNVVSSPGTTGIVVSNVSVVQTLSSCLKNVPPAELAMVEAWIKSLQEQ